MSANSLTNLERALSQSKAKDGISSTSPDGQQMCGDIDMRIARDGTWYYMGSPIGRMPLVRLFASVLQRDDSGDFWLITPAEMCRIQVDDAPFTAVDMTVDRTGAHQKLIFRTNLDEIVTAGPDNPIRVEVDPDSQEPAPYITVKDGLDALISRAVFYDLVEIAEVRDGSFSEMLGVWSSGEFFEIGYPGSD
jgi:uncharacterized protein